MGQTQTTSSKAESYTWGCEIECFLPQSKVQELGISIGSYHLGHPLLAPFPQGWTAERDGSLHTDRRGYVAVEIVSPILQGRAGIEQVKQVAGTLKGIGAVVNPSCGFHCHTGLASVVGDQPADVADWVAKLLPSRRLLPKHQLHRRESRIRPVATLRGRTN